jgi:uncharacterized Zn-binding protein involved in type VI secretion
MAGEIIRKGDSTSHGGVVLEGSLTDICHGKPIAYIGHKTHCPKCKGDFPIVEGVLTTSFYGKGVASAGMKTSCGATLIAGQFTDTVEWGGGSSVNPGRQRNSDVVASTSMSRAMLRSGQESSQNYSSDDNETIVEQYYALINEHGVPVDDYHYDLYALDTLHTKGGKYLNGETTVVTGKSDLRLVTWLSRDGAMK